MVRSSPFVSIVLAVVGLVQPNAASAQDVAEQVIGGSGITPPNPPSSGRPSTSLTACAPDATTCGGQVPTTVTSYNGVTTLYKTSMHTANTTVIHVVDSTTVIVSKVPATTDVVLCPNVTTTYLPIPSVVEILVNHTSTGTFIATSINTVSATTYITESAVSACVKSAYNVFPAAAVVAGGNSSQSSQAAAAAEASDSDEAARIDIDEADAGTIPEPASEAWIF